LSDLQPAAAYDPDYFRREVGGFMTELRSRCRDANRLVRDATGIVVDALGEPRMRELPAQGEAKDHDQGYADAPTHIDEYLAELAPEAT
jgi:hypothetical protein